MTILDAFDGYRDVLHPTALPCVLRIELTLIQTTPATGIGVYKDDWIAPGRIEMRVYKYPLSY